MCSARGTQVESRKCALWHSRWDHHHGAKAQNFFHQRVTVDLLNVTIIKLDGNDARARNRAHHPLVILSILANTLAQHKSQHPECYSNEHKKSCCICALHQGNEGMGICSINTCNMHTPKLTRNCEIRGVTTKPISDHAAPGMLRTSLAE